MEFVLIQHPISFHNFMRYFLQKAIEVFTVYTVTVFRLGEF